MGALHSRWHNGNLLFYDTYLHRLVDAIGMDVTKYILSTAALACDDTTLDPAAFITTTVDGDSDGNGSVLLTDNKLVITTDDKENDGAGIQLRGEAFDLASGNFTYFGIKLQVNDATQTDMLVGLCITDTTLLGGMTDGVYFECLDGSTDINFVLEKNSTETTSAAAVGTLADATDIVLEFVFDGTYVDAWVDGELQTRLAVTNLPSDEQLTPSIEFLTGEAAAQTLSVAWWRVIQVNA